MADPYAPVAAGIIPPNPNQGLTTLSNLLGLQQQRQAFLHRLLCTLCFGLCRLLRRLPSLQRLALLLQSQQFR